MNLGEALENLKHDNRMQDWNLSQGILTQKDIESYENSLEDLSGKCVPLDLESERRSSMNGDHSLGLQ